MSIWGVVPFRGAHMAKRRLEHALPQKTRSQLVLAMLDDVLEALTGATQLDGVMLVSRSQEATDIARRWGITLFRESGNTLVEALIEASDMLAENYKARGVMIVPGDVPLITPSEVDAIVRVQGPVTIVPDAHKVGTNALVCRPPNAFRYIFDGRSYHPHVQEAERMGFKAKTVILDSFGIDVDTVEDLAMVYSAGGHSRTAQLLHNDESLRSLLQPASTSQRHSRI